jgi:chitinase
LTAFTLADPGCSTPGCIFTGGANAGECTKNVGTLSYAEIRRIIDAGATVTLDETAAVKMVTYGGNQWVSYDDEDTMRMKIDFANKLCLGG